MFFLTDPLCAAGGQPIASWGKCIISLSFSLTSSRTHRFYWNFTSLGTFWFQLMVRCSCRCCPPFCLQHCSPRYCRVPGDFDGISRDCWPWFRARPAEVRFSQEEVKFLGHQVLASGICPLPGHVEAVKTALAAAAELKHPQTTPSA